MSRGPKERKGLTGAAGLGLLPWLPAAVVAGGDWQAPAALALVALAAALLARRWWRARRAGRCDACGSCPAAKRSRPPGDRA